jgi:ABC-2 type transport system permease protein
MKEMLNKTTFITNIVFMILNNVSFIIQWSILYTLKDNVGGYEFKEVMLLWGIGAGTYGVSRFFFDRAFNLSEIINNGKLDSYLVQPKNVLISTITSDVKTSAIGDLIYGYIMLFVYGFTIKRFLLYTLLITCGGLILVSIAVILGSLSFWFNKSDIISDTGNSLMVNFASYPDGIFKGLAKILLFTLIPVGIANYIPVHIITNFNLGLFMIVMLTTIFLILISFIIFNKGLKKYSSTNLMIARI